jgi:hypothetical protein
MMRAIGKFEDPEFREIEDLGTKEKFKYVYAIEQLDDVVYITTFMIIGVVSFFFGKRIHYPTIRICHHVALSGVIVVTLFKITVFCVYMAGEMIHSTLLWCYILNTFIALFVTALAYFPYYKYQKLAYGKIIFLNLFFSSSTRNLDT